MISTATKSPGLMVAHMFAVFSLFVVLSEMVRLNGAGHLLAFYGTYHQEPTNQIIHFFGVPAIIWSILLFFAHLPLPGVDICVSGPWIPSHKVTYATLLSIAYALFYVYVDRIGGTLYLAVLFLKYTSVVRMVSYDQSILCKKLDQAPRWYGTGRPLLIALAAQFVSWYLQIHFGHYILEGSQPAIMTSLGPTFTIAPLFAFYEGVWLCGINKALQEETLRLVAENTARLCEAGANMRVCASL